MFGLSCIGRLWLLRWCPTARVSKVSVAVTLTPHEDGLVSSIVQTEPCFGKFLTRSPRMVKKHCQESDSDVCPFCPCSDSRFHRFWECPQFASHRKHLSEFDLNTVVSLPECLTACGCALHPTTQWEWLQHLASVPNPCPRPLQLTGPLHLFTDGSCHNQHCAVTRFAGWSVILASFDWVSPPGSSRELAVGHLPGILQSAVRAETFAVLQALLLTQDHPDSVTIWTDCEAVVKKLRRVLAGHDIAANSASR